MARYQRMQMSFRISIDPKRELRVHTEHAQEALKRKLFRLGLSAGKPIVASTEVRAAKLGPPEPYTITTLLFDEDGTPQLDEGGMHEAKTRVVFRVVYVVACNVFVDVLPEHAQKIAVHLDDGPVGELVWVPEIVVPPGVNGHA